MSKNRSTDTIKITPTNLKGKPLKSRPFMKSKNDSGVRSRDYKFDKKKKGGMSDFGMLSVKAGIDKNPNPTKADRIAGAKMKPKKAALGMMMLKKAMEKDDNVRKKVSVMGIPGVAASQKMKKATGGMVESRGQKKIQIKKVPFKGLY